MSCCCDSWQLYRHMSSDCGYKTQCYTLSHISSPRSAQDAGLCLLLETCRGFHNDHVARQLHIGKMYPVLGVYPPCHLWQWCHGNQYCWDCVSVGFWVAEILRHDPSSVTVPSSFVRFDKVICFYPPWPESNWMIKWQSFMFHHLAPTITSVQRWTIISGGKTSDSSGVCCILKLVKTYIE